MALNTAIEPCSVLRHEFTAMASPCCFHLPDLPGIHNLAQAMEAEVRRIEQKYSRYRHDSVLSRLNAHAGKTSVIDAETAWLLNYARVCFEQSDGLFDISSGILRSAWDFRSPSLPAEATLNALLPRIGLTRLRLQENELLMPADMELDFGGIGKEYAADCAAAIARNAGVHQGIVDLGGDLHILGPKITAQGEQPWLLGVRNPRQPEQAIAQLPVYRGGMATSGDYERYFELDGRRYCHLLNPHTGWPVSYWASVTVLAPSCLLAGTLSSIAMLREASATNWLQEQDVHALLIEPSLQLQALTPPAG
ncbi:MAG: FAD:protein FMN transferase [Saccharospirillaceae bacterium]|nr:FAD:protein FMN transferase [Saccharospirillaceae bacterium]